MERHRFRWIAIALLDLRSDPPFSLIITFVSGILLFGIVSNLIYETSKDFPEVALQEVIQPIISAGLLLWVGGTSFQRYRKQTSIKIELNENPSIPPKKYVVTSLSPYKQYPNGSDNLDVVRKLIELHKSALVTVFVISILQSDTETGEAFSINKRNPDNEGVLEAYYKLKDKYKSSQAVNIELHGIYNTDSAEQSFEAAIGILNQVDIQDCVIDVTAGKKAMSVGLSAAAFAYGCSITYLATPRDKSGEPDFNANPQFIMLESGNLRTHIIRHSKTTD